MDVQNQVFSDGLGIPSDLFAYSISGPKQMQEWEAVESRQGESNTNKTFS